MKTKTALLFLMLTIFSFGQEQKTGEILITREHLISLLQKFKVDNNYVVTNNSTSKLIDATSKNKLITENKYPNDSVLQKINQLEKQLTRLNSRLDTIPKYVSLKDTVFINYDKNRIVKTDTIHKYVSSDTTKYAKSNYSTDTMKYNNNAEYEKKLAELNAKYEELLKNQKTILANQTKKEEVVVAENPILKKVAKNPIAEITKTENPIVTTAIPVNKIVVIKDTVMVIKPVLETKPVLKSVSNYDVLVSKYSSLKKQVFFENNESKLTTNDMNMISELISILNQNNTVDVFLEGFASKKGNAVYNETLSLKRTESVKQLLIHNGIHPKRILSQYHGVDAAATNEAFARRVDVTFEVRK